METHIFVVEITLKLEHSVPSCLGLAMGDFQLPCRTFLSILVLQHQSQILPRLIVVLGADQDVGDGPRCSEVLAFTFKLDLYVQ